MIQFIVKSVISSGLQTSPVHIFCTISPFHYIMLMLLHRLSQTVNLPSTVLKNSIGMRLLICIILWFRWLLPLTGVRTEALGE